MPPQYGPSDLDASTVPLAIDSVKSGDGFDMTRCSYLLIEAGDPDRIWTITSGNRQLPFAMISLSGIIFRPPSDEQFTTPDLIEETYDFVEKELGLSISPSSVWLPNKLMPSPKLEEGTVLRAGWNMLALAMRHWNGTLANEEYLQQAFEVEPRIAISEEETKAFTIWHDSLIEDSRRLYHENVSKALEWSNDDREESDS